MNEHLVKRITIIPFLDGKNLYCLKYTDEKEIDILQCFRKIIKRVRNFLTLYTARFIYSSVEKTKRHMILRSIGKATYIVSWVVQ